MQTAEAFPINLYPLSQAQRTVLLRWPPVWLTTKPCCGESGVLQYMATMKKGIKEWDRGEEMSREEETNKRKGEQSLENKGGKKFKEGKTKIRNVFYFFLKNNKYSEQRM